MFSARILQCLDLFLAWAYGHQCMNDATEKACARSVKVEDLGISHRILELVDQLQTELGIPNRVVFKETGGRVIFLELDEIEWVEAAANYVTVGTAKGSYLLREQIGHVSERLDPNRFIRIHRSVVVNARKIRELQPVNSGEYIVVLKSGRELPCSRGFRSGLQQLVDNSPCFRSIGINGPLARRTRDD
jgi:DNA-binding LytR/AlgR family response regulator